MAHGTSDPSNAYYAVMQDRLDVLYGGKVMIYTVEGWPRLENVIPKLKEKDEEDSHKTILQKEGFKVNTYIHGIGENKNVLVAEK